MRIEDKSINNSILSLLSCGNCSSGMISCKNNGGNLKDFQDAPGKEEYEAVLSSANDVNFLTQSNNRSSSKESLFLYSSRKTSNY